ncbi:hypothetical protein PVAND_011400 [Polypedilum vanderplanki]|uniref:B box-type domain-containing protein n=1 Tax=Polypedilum vanderplanki TaxID=319348 RepID=A0A9J6CJ33_POLVA|nr:hypothetical protein PVAND_011400 [Polypedilum vanderplanki]
MDSILQNNSDENDKKRNDISTNLFLNNLLNTLPKIDTLQNRPAQIDNSKNGNSIFSNMLPFEIDGNNKPFNYKAESPLDLYGAAPGSNIPKQKIMSRSTSPHSSTSSSQSIYCGRCENNACHRCLDCNDVFCSDCVNEHMINSFTEKHNIISIGKITPIGSIGSGVGIGAPSQSLFFGDLHMHSINEPQCESHNEQLRFLCNTCKKVICQECSLKEHKDHEYISVSNITVDKAKDKLKAICESSKLGIKFIKTSIDRAVAASQSVERDALEISSRVRKALRLLILACEEREKSLLSEIDKYRQQRIANLSDQMLGLRSALAGLAQTSESLTKMIDNVDTLPQIEIALLLTNSESQIEKFAAMYKSLQPKEEGVLTFVPPNFDLLQDIRNQGEIVINSRSNSANLYNNNNGSNGNGSVPIQQPSAINRRPVIRQNVPTNGSNGSGTAASWNESGHIEKDSIAAAIVSSTIATTQSSNSNSSYVVSNKSYASMVKPPTTIIGQCILGSHHISVKPALAPSLTFCFDGHEDGEVSRPWGICVNKNNEIIVADRRNNRIQVFYADGTFKFKFGSKGTGNGQFDLPAGLAVDAQNRIVVVDKDNHRVQVFSCNGNFITKFGSYGKEIGQFMYPWAVAINTKSQVLITDSRNHRIQMFSIDGHFISRFSFDGINHSRYLKGLTTPRGCAFTPEGNIIISDFENHRLILLDSSMTKILATKGHEGNALNEFCRPSGIACDDDGRVIVSDSKNQRVLIFSAMLEFLWAVEIRPSSHNILTANMDEKDRPSDVALLNDGRLIVVIETSPDSREIVNPQKTFIQVY